VRWLQGSASPPSCPWRQLIQRAPHASPALIQNVRIDDRRAHVAMRKEFLDGPNVVPALEKVRRKRVAKGGHVDCRL